MWLCWKATEDGPDICRLSLHSGLGFVVRLAKPQESQVISVTFKSLSDGFRRRPPVPILPESTPLEWR
eukprot:SAG25_NODE_33_length_20262_cov_33.203293_22_plen_68_part_00